MKTTLTKHTFKRILSLCAVLAVLMTVLALPVSAKSAGGFQYFLTETYEDEKPFAIITGHKRAVNGKLAVPAAVNGYEVYRIADAAFSGRTDITSVVLPDTVTWVGEFAFENCTNLKTLTVGSAFIGRGAFSGCTALKTVNFTGYNFEQMHPKCSWETSENDPLFNAKQNWVHYKKAYTQVDEPVKCCTGRNVTLTCEYSGKKGDEFHWYSEDGYCLNPEQYWGDCTQASVTASVIRPDEETIFCEVVNAKGDVVFLHVFHVHAYPTLCYSVRNLAQETWLYGVANYTVNHIRWQYIDPVLGALGVEVY